jgi:beta-lactamase superfamily II metal-dependent hydrolase
LAESNKDAITSELIKASKGVGIVRFISTHPDEDHIRGLKHLNQKLTLQNFYCVKNEATKEDETEDFQEYCTLRESSKAFFIYKGCTRKWMNLDGDGRSTSGIDILWPNTNNKIFQAELLEAKNGLSPNNISPIIRYSVNGSGSAMWMGDLEEWFMEDIATELKLSQTDIVFAPHHGRDSGKIPDGLLKILNPKIIVVGEAPSKYLHYYPNYNTITQNSSGDIAFQLENGNIHVFVSNENYSVNFLKNLRQENLHGFYIGSLTV